MIKIFREQIRWKLLLLLSLLLIGLACMLTVQHVLIYETILQKSFQEEKSLLKDNMILRAKNHTESLAIQLENELAVYNFSKFSDLVMDDDKKNENIYYISVQDSEGNTIVRSNESIGDDIPFSSVDMNASTIHVSERVYDTHPVLEIRKNLYLGSEPWGVVTVCFTLSELEHKILDYSRQLQENINYSLVKSFFSMALFLILFLPVVYTMASHISKPIINLTMRAEELSKGNFTQKCTIAESRKDELGTLARTFDTMSDNLQNSYKRLADYNTQLEGMVQARTLELKDKNLELERLAVTDRLTQLYNRVKLEEIFSEQIQLAKRYNTPFSILLCDLDHFKDVNDRFGHLIGDQVLLEVANIFTTMARDTDIIGRWGGEEFLIICCETNEHNAFLLAERLRNAVKSHPFITNEVQTISIGVSSFLSKDCDVSMLERADRALYLAKNDGRNCTVFAPV